MNPLEPGGPLWNPGAVKSWHWTPLAVLIPMLAACRTEAPRSDPVWEELVRWTDDQREAWHVPGVALGLVRDGWAPKTVGLGVQQVGADAPVTPDTVFRVGSLSKLVTGVLALQLVEEGRLAPDDTLDALLPDLSLASPQALAQLTLEGVLSHSSGLQSTGLPNACSTAPDALGTVLADRAPDWDLWVAPDTFFQYASPGFALAGHAVERAAHVPFAALARERVFAPAGLDTMTYDVDVAVAGACATGHSMVPGTGDVHIYRDFTERDCGAANPSGGLMSSVHDLAQVVQVLLDGGEPWLGAVAFEQLTTTGWDFSSSASYGWGLLPTTYRGHRIWLHTGSLKGFQAMLVVLPDARAGVVVLVNSDHAVTDPPEPWSKPTQRIAMAAMDGLLGLPAEPKTSSVRPVADWDRFVGRYLSDFDLGELEVTLDQDSLWLARRPDTEPEALLPYSANTFQAPYEGSDGRTYYSRFSFETDHDGQVAWIASGEGIAARVDP